MHVIFDKTEAFGLSKMTVVTNLVSRSQMASAWSKPKSTVCPRSPPLPRTISLVPDPSDNMPAFLERLHTRSKEICMRPALNFSLRVLLGTRPPWSGFVWFDTFPDPTHPGWSSNWTYRLAITHRLYNRQCRDQCNMHAVAPPRRADT